MPPPKHILGAPTKLMRDEGYGAGYIYDHDVPGGFSGQNYFPDRLPRETFYVPTARGAEAAVAARLAPAHEARRAAGERARAVAPGRAADDAARDASTAGADQGGHAPSAHEDGSEPGL